MANNQKGSSMISVEEIEPKEVKYCIRHCDKRAKYIIRADNPKVIQNSPIACFCTKCYEILKRCLK